MPFVLARILDNLVSAKHPQSGLGIAAVAVAALVVVVLLAIALARGGPREEHGQAHIMGHSDILLP